MKRRLGFRFRPNDEQLIEYYLKGKLLGLHSEVDQSIAEVIFLNYEPWDLRAVSKEKSNDQFWYFVYQLDHKSNGVSRKTGAGYWKATGKDRNVRSGDTNKLIGIKKTLVFYRGRVSKKVKSVRTNWVIHEYHIITDLPNPKNYVICRLKNKVDGKASSLTPDEVESSHQSSLQLPSDFGSHVALTHDEVESSSQSPSDFGNPVAEVEPPPQADPGAILDCDELDNDLFNPEQGLSLQDLPSSNSFNSNCNGVQNPFGTEPPLSNSFSRECNEFPTQLSPIEPGEDLGFSDSFLDNECNTCPGETSSLKNSVAESECWNWEFDGMSIAHLPASFGGSSYNGGMISDANHELAIEQVELSLQDLPSSNSFNSNCNGVQNPFGTEPPLSNSFSRECNEFPTQLSPIEPGEDLGFSDSFLDNECNTCPGETSSLKNSVAEGECWNWEFDGMSIAHLLASFGGSSYNGGMISDANHELAIEQAREAVEHGISSDLNSEVELEYIPEYITVEPYFDSSNSPTTNKF